MRYCFFISFSFIGFYFIPRQLFFFRNICIYIFGLEYKISLSNCFRQICPSVFVAVLFNYCVHIPPAFPYCPCLSLVEHASVFFFLQSPYVFECSFAFLCVHVHIVLIEFEYFDSSVHQDDAVLSWNICLSLVRGYTSNFSQS